MEFDTLEAAEEQFKNSGMEIRGQKLFVDFASNRKRCEICMYMCACIIPYSCNFFCEISANTPIHHNPIIVGILKVFPKMSNLTTKKMEIPTRK